MRRLIPLVLLALIGVSTLGAGAIPFFVPGTDVGPFTMNSNETRETLFQVLNSVTLTEIGAQIDPSSSTSQFRWRVFNSDSSFTFGSSIFDTTVSYTDVGMATYNTPLSLALTSGNFYILSLQTVEVSASMERYNESDQGLPLVTSDNNFSVRDGSGNGNFNNFFLPAFSVTTGLAAVPEPASVVLLAAGLIVLGWWRRRSAVSDAARST